VREIDAEKAALLIGEQARIDLELELTGRRAEAEKDYLAKHQEAVHQTQKYLDDAKLQLQNAIARTNAAQLEAETIESAARSINTKTTDDARLQAETLIASAEAEARNLIAAAKAKVAKELDESTARLQQLEVERRTVGSYLEQLEKIVAAIKSTVSARSHKETQRRKNSLESSSLPSKLVDCRTNETISSELFIVEGDSALGTAKLARDSEFQALLPIRGKILNVQKASVSDMLSNTECASIIQVIGAGSGRSFDLELARYGKVILMSDADVDGAHIRTLLLTLIYRYMRPLVEDGRVYAAVPPLHRVEVVNAGSKANEVIYTYSQAELEALLIKLEKAGKRYKEPIQRYKGLGEMDADQLAETTMSRSHRTLRRVNIVDAEFAEKTFELLMGNEVAPRRDFIVDSADGLERDRIDA
jgi:DNA gyrase subunit B